MRVIDILAGILRQPFGGWRSIVSFCNFYGMNSFFKKRKRLSVKRGSEWKFNFGWEGEEDRTHI